MISTSRVPRWDEVGGPWLPVARLARRRDRESHTVRWTLAAKHVERVWKNTYTRLNTDSTDKSPLAFVTALAQHSYDCGRCNSSEGLELWVIVMKYTPADEIVKAISLGRKSG